MTRSDSAGLTLTAASADAVIAWDALLDDYAAFRSTLPDRLRELLATDPEMPLAHSTRAALMMLAGKGELVAVARSAADAAVRHARGATRREQMHAGAVQAWVAGDIARATATWEFILALAPTDMLALKLAQFAHFYAGDTEAMRRSVDGVADAWDASVPRQARFLGMRAFALEECGEVDAAEALGREAVAREADDPWAIHAVAHCLETRGDPAGGRAWLDAHSDDWRGAGTMDGHLRWHRALFTLETDGAAAVLAQFDTQVQVQNSEEYLDLCNDIALLQRLELRGVDVADRYQRIAAAVEARAGDRLLAFCDAHWALGLAAAGRTAAAEQLLASMLAAGAEDRSDADSWRSAAVPLARGLIAFRAGDHVSALDLMWTSRDRWYLLGGSRAQRDLFEQILAATAAGAGEQGLAQRLLAERQRSRPHEHAWLHPC